MVSFQCEGCGDVIKKPKLDSHRGQCRGATFSCLDCSVHFRGTDYRSHTSCMTEDQKYQGHLYREKPTKASKRKSVSILEPSEDNALVSASHHAYVEDAPDVDSGAPPPHVPSPPPAVAEEFTDGVNVFDFLVNDSTPNTSREVAARKKGYRNSEEQLPSDRYDEEGYTYGAEPVNPRPVSGGVNNNSFVSLDFMTPAAKESRSKLDKQQHPESATHSRMGSTDKKRKRGQVEDPYAQITTYELEGDTLMPDAPQTATRQAEIAHSGLTGSLTRLMSHDDDESYPFPPTQEQRENERRPTRRDRNQNDDPSSPLKRSRKSKDVEESTSRDRNGLGISIKGRASKAMSVISGAGVLAALTNPAAAQNHSPPSQALVKKEKAWRSSDDNFERERGGSLTRGERKKYKVPRHNGTSRENVKFDGSRSVRRRSRGDDRSRSPERRNGNGNGKVKAIEYHKSSREESESDSDAPNGHGNGMVIFGAREKHRLRCESFLGFVTKGPESEKGCSLNKALKRWHRDAGMRRSEEKADEEKELWRGLRLKRNEMGEVVVFF